MTATMKAPKTRNARKPSKATVEKAVQRHKMATTTNAPDAGATAPSAPLFGEIIGWELPPSMTVPFSQLVQALRDSGLDESAVRERVPRNAFARACRNLSEARVIRQVREDDMHLYFQFTKEERTEDSDCPLAYAKEAILRLNKANGDIDSDNPELSAHAKELLDKHLVMYTTGDVTSAVQRLFDREAGLPGTALFSFKRGAGVYFVPQELGEFLVRIEGFVGRLSGTLTRWPIYRGNALAARSVRESMAEGLQALVAEYEAAVAAFGSDTRDDTLKRHAERIQQTRYKVEAYAEYLEDRKGDLLAALAACADKLKSRVALIGQCREADILVDCEHCRAPNPVVENEPTVVCRACGRRFDVEW